MGWTDRRTRVRAQQLRGFTLLELLMTLALLAIAAGFGLATYGKTIEHARAEVAIQNLRAIQAGQEFYKSRTGAYGSWASAADMAFMLAQRLPLPVN